MRMEFRCKNCGRMFYFHDRLTNAVIAFMEARQRMWRVLYDKDFSSRTELGIVNVVENNARCCTAPKIGMLEFHGYE